MSTRTSAVATGSFADYERLAEHSQRWAHRESDVGRLFDG